MIKVNIESSGITQKFIDSSKVQKKLKTAHEALHSVDKSAGTGWVNLPSETLKSEITNIKNLAKDIQDKCDLFLVVGIGGSYAGAFAGLEIFKKGKTEVKFIGTSFSARDLQSVLEDAKKREVFVNVISKSGETTETAVTFHIVEEFMKKKYKKGEYKKRIIVTTDYEKGRLREIATKEGYLSLIIPRTIGGRFSVFTPVGLLPLAVGGVNIEKLLSGARTAEKEYAVLDANFNPAYKYALARCFLYIKKKKVVETAVSFDTRLKGFFEWFKQLFAESEGKLGKGLFVSSLIYSTDLHSFGQFIQEGSPILFETMLDIEKQSADFELTNFESGLNGKKLSEIERATLNGVIEAHKEAGVPLITIGIEELTEEAFGELLYFMMIACAISAHLVGVNPFNQPGVEAYKQKTRELLGLA